MCTVIPANKLCADDLAVMSGRKVSEDCEEQEPACTLALDEFLPGEAFGFGSVTISQLVRPVDPRDLPGWT